MEAKSGSGISFEEAVKMCEMKNGKLAEIRSITENSAIFEKYDGEHLWLGITDHKNDHGQQDRTYEYTRIMKD